MGGTVTPAVTAVLLICGAAVADVSVFDLKRAGDSLQEGLGWTGSPYDLAEALNASLRTQQAKLLSPKCLLHLLEYAAHLVAYQPNDSEEWALQMFDATGKIPGGLLKGYGSILGNFDQCLRVQHESKLFGEIRGKYCVGNVRLLKVKKKPAKERDYYSTSVEIDQTGVSRMLDLNNGTFSIKWAICLPDSCTVKDYNFLHFLFFMKFTEESCQTLDSMSKEYDELDTAAIYILIGLACLLLSSTMFDIYVHHFGQKSPDQKIGYDILRSFSVIKNFSYITSESEKPTTITCLHGLRVISTLAIMGGLRVILLALGPLINWIDVLQWLRDKNLSVIIDGLIFGDTFLVLSGLLVSYNYLTASEEGTRFNVIVFYTKRIVRLFPALAMAVLLNASLLRHVGAGPLWPFIRSSYIVDNCREYWWSSLLFVQNYVNADIAKVCMLQTWQLSLEMQLFVLSPLLLIPLKRFPSYTIGVVGFILGCSILSSFTAAWVYQLKAVFRTYRRYKDIEKYVEHYYFPLHTHASPWLIGFLAGKLIHVTGQPKMKLLIKQKLNQYAAGLLWIASVGILVFCIMIGRDMMDKKYDWLEHALHIAFIRPLWALGVCWIIFACTHGYIASCNAFLSAPAFRYMSKISYSSHLISVTLMLILTHQTRTGIQFGAWSSLCNILGDVVISFAVGCVWSLAFELPFRTLAKVALRRTKYGRQ